MTILLVLTSLILISIAVWQLTKILELSKPTDFDDSEIASDNDNDIQVMTIMMVKNIRKNDNSTTSSLPLLRRRKIRMRIR